MKQLEVTIQPPVGRQIKHSYPIPYERDDDFIKRLSENDPYSARAKYEPAIGRTLYADANFEYNYYNERYENGVSEMLEDGLADENILPSLNYFLLRNNEMFDEDNFNKLFAFSEDISNSNIMGSKFLSDRYFSTFGNAVLMSVYRNVPKQVVSSLGLETEFISRKAIDIYADVENKREMFPYFAKIHLTGMQHSTFAEILEQSNLDKVFVDYLIMHRGEMETGEVSIDPSTLTPEVIRYSFNKLKEHINNHSEQSNSFGAGVEPQTCSALENIVIRQIGVQNLTDYVLSLNNQGSGETETVAFRLEKRDEEGSIINVKYFLNYSDLEEFKLFDSQVAYNKRYNYVIKAINLGFFDGYKGFFLLEEPYYEDYFRVLDSPPIAPDVEILTYRGISNKNLILFNSMIDQKVLKPVLINESDREGYDRQWEAQKILPENPILFETDDPAQYFEMFRLEEKPHSYQDFVNGKYIVIGEEGATSAAYNDMIEPNKTYYYTFRTLDIHGHVSSPTSVYEFRLNKEGETLYPTLRVVDFDPKDPPTQKNIAFKRFLKIGLAPSQYQIPEHVIADVTSYGKGQRIQIGTSEDNILTPTLEGEPRKFKFRIRSKNTGKLIDVNITFKKNGVFIE